MYHEVYYIPVANTRTESTGLHAERCLSVNSSWTLSHIGSVAPLDASIVTRRFDDLKYSINGVNAVS